MSCDVTVEDSETSFDITVDDQNTLTIEIARGIQGERGPQGENGDVGLIIAMALIF